MKECDVINTWEI